jgi:uncharacterized protein Yka (UPF0111/DUF47 family)
MADIGEHAERVLEIVGELERLEDESDRRTNPVAVQD